jgi:hypothetical protein
MSSGPILVPPATSRFRDMADAISPTWLNGPVGQRFRYSMAVLYDALADGAGYAVLSRFPQTAPADALPLIGADRQITRGFAESNASYENRLIQWLDLWRSAGSPMGVLLAVLGLFLPTSIKVVTVDNSSNWNTYALGANPFPITAAVPTPPVYAKGTNNWNWDGNFALWWRTWVILYVSPLGWTIGPHWGDGGHWGDVGRLWGLTGPLPGQIPTLLAVLKQWAAAHSWIVNVILTTNSARFDPAQPAGGGINPDGTWANPANRFTDCVFLDGVI